MMRGEREVDKRNKINKIKNKERKGKERKKK